MKRGILDVQHVGGPLYRVASESSSKVYEIDIERPFCNCPNFALQKNKLKSQDRFKEAEQYECKHLRAVRASGANVAEVMDANEKARVAAIKESIISRFEERDASPQEDALRAALNKEAALRKKKK